MAPVNEEWKKVVEEAKPAVEGLKGKWEELKEVLEAGAGSTSTAAGREVLKGYEENWGKLVGCMEKVQAATENYEQLSQATRRDAAKKEEELQKREAIMAEKEQRLAEKEKRVEERTKWLETGLREDLQQKFLAKFELEVQKIRAEKSTPKEVEMDKKMEKVDAMLDKVTALGTRVEAAEAGKEQTQAEMLATQLQVSEQAHTTAQQQAGSWKIGFSELRRELEKASGEIKDLKMGIGRLEEEKAQLQASLHEANIRLDEGRRVREGEQLKARADQAEARLKEIEQERKGSAVWKQLERANGQVEALQRPLVIDRFSDGMASVIEGAWNSHMQGLQQQMATEQDEDEEEPPRKRRRTGQEPERDHRPHDGDDDNDDDEGRGGGAGVGGNVPRESDGQDNGEGSSRQQGGQNESMVVAEDAGEVQQQAAPQTSLSGVLDQMRFPTRFDVAEFVRQLEQSQPNNGPAEWREFFGKAAGARKVVCVFGKLAVNKNGGYGYNESVYTREKCKYHAGKRDGLCVRLNRLGGEDGKTWELHQCN
ncbi:hypothetical protein LTR70_004316 [Exophiala xenobiotica]|uniref:Uncharacterized protein n=1 Tax=Lithohypha guttulata TaxID=1690604 RepID=A0ABR0KDV3_9EURO|nr:hypothetical protein LTR24_003719 [Lithohypha guttulata]KAK5321071.1 hypothetical protein LTR70_004316 [Exophiala xenobiotica]